VILLLIATSFIVCGLLCYQAYKSNPFHKAILAALVVTIAAINGVLLCECALRSSC
jgi:hypothetical protein